MAPFENPESAMWHKEHGNDLKNEALNLSEKPEDKKGEITDVTPPNNAKAGKVIRRRPQVENPSLN